ncbi:MAG: hypothetical protein methR_P2785 [Methyloprofundus sp.]|nr:MAG: hypothetical protein methR_P2785 [Methyloprofundus sp.]
MLGLLLSACNSPSEPTPAESVSQSLNQQAAEVDFKILDISEYPYENRTALRVFLSVPVDAKIDFNRHLRVSNKSGQPVDGHWILSKGDRQLLFPGIEPDQEYNVQVFKGLVAITAKTLAADEHKNIHTRSLPAFVDFASDGSLIPAELVQGLPVVAVNVQQVDVDFYRVTNEKISQFLDDWSGHASSTSAWGAEEYTDYADLVYSARFDLNPPANQRYTTHLDIKNIKTLNTPGVYLVVMKAAGQYDDYQITYFTISDIGLHVHDLSDELNVYVSSLATGKAIADVELSFLDRQGQVLAVLHSNKQGSAQLRLIQDKARVLVAKQGQHLSVLNLKRAALDLSEFAVQGKSYQPLELFVYGPRDLYRPGEKVYFNGLLRNEDGKKVAVPPLKAILKRPGGQAMHYFTWQADKTGLYQYEFTLPRQARTGEWQLDIAMPDGNSAVYSFSVEDFMPERMALQLGTTEQSKWIFKEQALEVAVEGRYLYGAPAKGNKVSSSVSLQANRQPIKQFKDFLFGVADAKIPYSAYDSIGNDIRLDSQGKGQLVVDSKWTAVSNTPVNIALSTSLYETGSRAINRFVNYTYWPQETLFGIKAVSDLDALTANSEVEFAFINARHDGQLTATAAEVTLIHEQRDYYWANTGNGWEQKYTENNSPVFVQTVQLTDKQPNTLKLPVQQGQYLLQISNPETGQLSSYRFQVGYQWDELTAQSARPDRVRLQWDKPAYLPGDIAKLKIISPHAGNGFVVIESSKQALWFARINVPAKGMTLAIPVDESWHRHDIYATSVVFKAGDVQQKITPNRAVGVLHLKLDREPRTLQLEVTTETEKIQPETTLTTQIKLLNAKADETVYVTLAAVDVGALSMSHFVTPKPQKYFWEQRRYAIDQHDLYGNIVEIMDAGLSKARFGGDAAEDDGTMPRTDVKIVSLFTGPVKLDQHGVASIPLDIPDFNGKLRLMALAYSDNRFGAAENYITVAAPIVAEAALPRFLAGNDRSIFTLDMLNQSGVTQTLTITIDSTGPVKLKATTQTIVLQDQQKQILRFPLQAEQQFAQATINLHITNGEQAKQAIDIKRQWPLAVRPAYPAIHQVIHRQIPAHKSQRIKVPLQPFLLNSTQATLTLSAQPPLNIAEQLSELLAYPYGCLEQTTSTSYPWLFLNAQRMQQFKLNTLTVAGEALDLSQQTAQINRSIIRLAGMQLSNGSFGLWGSDSHEERWLTAYVSDFLLDARENGFAVPEPLLSKALTRLLYYVNYSGWRYTEANSPYPEHSRFAYQAYAAYVLARLNRAPLGSLRTLYDHHKQEAKSGLPLVHLGLALLKQGDTSRGNIAIQQGIAMKRNARLYLADYGSPLRDLSLMTYLVNKYHIAGTEQVLPKLNSVLSNRQYLSTQERNALFLVAIELANHADKAWSATLQLPKTKLTLTQNKAYQQTYKASDIPAHITVKSAHEQALFLQMAVNGYPNKAPAVEESTFQSKRNYYSLKGELVDLAHLSVGELVLVHVQVKANAHIKQALVVDLIPAGFELENQNLANSMPIADLPFSIEGEKVSDIFYYSRLDYQEYRDDRYIAALDMQEGEVSDLFYLVRMVTPGTYTVPPVYVEDMYRPYIRGIGKSEQMAKISEK